MIIFIFAIEFAFAFIFAFNFLFFSFVFCDYVFENHFMTQNLKTLYNMHFIENVKILRCNWFIQIKKTQKTCYLRKHELQIKNKIKQKTKNLIKQQEKIRLIKKRTKKFTCKRCKYSIKFNNNIKLHEHIRIRQTKKSKFVQQFVEYMISFFISFVLSFRSIIFLFSTSSKFLFFSIFISEILFERLENVLSKSLIIFFSKFLSIATSRKSIF